jgi:formylglycine-generating enzyme required for sulfatase activity
MRNSSCGTTLVGALALFLACGCRVGDDTQLEARRCSIDQECKSGWRCESGWCQAPLSGDVAEDATDDVAQDTAGEVDTETPDLPSDTGSPDQPADREPDVDEGCAFGADCQDGETCEGGECCQAGVCSSPMMAVAGQTFSMGCTPTGDPECGDAEQPEHPVTVPAFEMDVTEVTNAHYAQFLNAQGSNLCAGLACVDEGDSDLMLELSGDTWRVVTGAESLPVVEVTWYGAGSYCAWAGKRLCNEAEWELAARGPEHYRYPWGNDPPTCSRAHTANCSATVEPVGTRTEGRSYDGIHDLAANVREWIEDDWHETYTGAPDDGSAWTDEPRPAEGRVIRGGSADSDDVATRAAYRAFYHRLDDGHATRGFRCCR